MDQVSTVNRHMRGGVEAYEGLGKYLHGYNTELGHHLGL